MFKHWVNIMCLASEQDERGSLPTASDIAFALRLKPCEAKKIIGALIAEKLIDESDEGHLSVHGWDNRQQESDNVATRVKEYRDRKNDDQRKERADFATKSRRAYSASGTEGIRENDAPHAQIDENVTLPKRYGNGTDGDRDIDKIRVEDNRGECAREAPSAKKSRQAAPTPIPPDFSITDSMRAWALLNHPTIPLERETDKFRSYFLATGKVFRDWSQAWQNWIRRAEEITDDRRARESAIAALHTPKESIAEMNYRISHAIHGGMKTAPYGESFPANTTSPGGFN